MNREQQFLAADQAARVAALDVTRSFIVQAPAGSGKTELLIQRYLRLLVTVDDPEEILAITFTRKAAAEMRIRVLNALKSARRGDAASEPHQQITSTAATAVLERDRKFQWSLITNPGRMRIQTLDSLNASISRMQPMSVGSSATQSAIVADAEMTALYRRAALLTLDQLLETGPLQDATQKVLLHVDNNTWLYISYVAQMLATRDQWLPFVGSGLIDPAEQNALRARFESNLTDVVAGQLQFTVDCTPMDQATALLESARYAAAQLREVADDSDIALLADLDTLPLAEPSGLRQWQAIAELLLTLEGQWRKTVNKNQGFPVGDKGQKKVMLSLLSELATNSKFRDSLHAVRTLPPVTYSDEQWSVLLALFRLLPLAVTELKRLFAERGIADYIEVALSAADALGTADDPGDIALLLDYQLRHLLVDEMQDTSSAQYRMLEALTGGWEDGDGRTLFCVGDPMQSIYRFRNAEVGQFLLAKDSGIGPLFLEPLTLRRNFRSGENLVNWFNEVFPEVLAERDDAAQGAVAYAAAVSVPQHAQQGQCVMHPVFGSDTDDEATSGFNVIRDIQSTFPDDDIAVLVRGRSHLRQMLARLRRENVAYRAVEIDRLTDLPEIIDILSLTRALVHRGDRVAWLAMLRSPWAGLNWTDLHALVLGAGDATVWELIQDAEALSRLSEYGQTAARRMCTLLQPAMRPNRTEALRDRIEKAWLSLGGGAIVCESHAIENVYRYLDVVEHVEQGGTLADVAELEATLDLEHVSSDSNARLHVMTMHRAKGLQFDHVLLFGLGRTPAQHDRSVLSWFDLPGNHGRDEKIISPVGPRGALESDPLHRYIEKVEAGKFRQETGRLLYVACTRARKSLHLIGHVEVAADGAAIRPARAGSLLSLLWHKVAANFDAAFAAASLPQNKAQESPWMLPALRRFEEPFSLPAFVGAAATDAESKAPEAASQVEFYWVGTEARMAGTLVHRWLQLAAEQRVSLDLEDLNQILPVTLRWLRAMGVSGSAADGIGERVAAAMRGILGDEKGRWLLHGEGAAELALTGIYEGQLTSVVLDRVRIDQDGTHWIVDYKTSSHEGGDLAAFLSAEADRYRPQLHKYKELYAGFTKNNARCALYFPLLQQFVEVDL